MYTALTTITCVIIILLTTSAILIPEVIDESDKKQVSISLLLLISAILLSVVFAKTTTTVLSKTPDAKQSKQPWLVVYKNNINADIKIESTGSYDDTITPKNTVSKKDFDQFMPSTSFPWNNADEAAVNITAKNDVDSTTKTVTLSKDNIIETWPNGMKPNKSKGHITKIEYRSTPVTQKWFNIPVDKTDYQEIRITIEYEGQNNPSTKQLFGED